MSLFDKMKGKYSVWGTLVGSETPILLSKWTEALGKPPAAFSLFSSLHTRRHAHTHNPLASWPQRVQGFSLALKGQSLESDCRSWVLVMPLSSCVRTCGLLCLRVRVDDMCVLIVKIECKAHRAARGTYGHSANESHDCGILPLPSPRRTRSQLPVQSP